MKMHQTRVDKVVMHTLAQASAMGVFVFGKCRNYYFNDEILDLSLSISLVLIEPIFDYFRDFN